MKLPFDTTWNFLGLSTDVKPDQSDSRVVDGSTFLEVDTSKLYIFTRGVWYEKTSSVQTNLEKEMEW